MKKQILKSSIIAAISVVISATVLVGSQTNPSAKTLKTPTPSPTPQKVGCSVPNADELSNRSNENTSTKSKGRSAESVSKMAKILDWDCDGVSNHYDNCTYTYNSTQRDRNKNGIGDACEVKKRRPKKSAGKKQKFGV